MRFLLLALLLPALAVSQELLPEAQISWQVPAETVGGQPLEIGGFEVVYREVDATEWTRLLLTNPDRTSLTVDLDPGDYEARIAVYDERYCYGDWSEPAHFTIAAHDRPPAMTFSVVQGEKALANPADNCTDDCTIVED